MPHLISITGAGTGDPELLTVRAQKRLSEADYILYDALIGTEMLALAKEGAVKIYVGKWCKDGQNQEERQSQIHGLLLQFATGNNRIVRLKTGDPMVFGRGAEEIGFCEENNLNYEVIPGVTAGLAASSVFGIPITERGKNNLCMFYTAQRLIRGFAGIEAVIQVLKTGSPVVIYMGLTILEEFSVVLIKKGIQKNLPIQVLSSLSQPGQQICSTTIGDVGNTLKKVQPGTPAIIIIGKYARRLSTNNGKTFR